MNTCEELENRFASDLKKGEIKYFQFGFGIDIGLQEHLKDKYKIESYIYNLNYWKSIGDMLMAHEMVRIALVLRGRLDLRLRLRVIY